MLTYLDSLMIENPASFSQLNADQLSSTTFRNTGNIFNTNSSAGEIFTVGLSTQRLSADRANIRQLSAFDAVVQNLTAINVTFEDTDFAETVNNTIYVSMAGKDTNGGRNIFDPVRTIKRACQIAHNDFYTGTYFSNFGVADRRKMYTIFVGTGDYEEENPIYIPPNTSIIGDNLRRTSVYPLHKTWDLFWCNNSVYMWGFTFRGHCEPGACTSYPDFDGNQTARFIALSGLVTPKWPNPGQTTVTTEWRYPYITTSPYIQGSSSIARMLTANRFQLTNQQQAPAVSTNWSLTNAGSHIERLFDDITFTMLSGLSAAPRRTSTGSNSTVNANWDAFITSNTEFIKSETEQFIFTAYRHLSAGGKNTVSDLNYDRTKCARDVGFILSAVRADMLGGHNDHSRYNANFYWQQGVSKVTGNGDQLPATVTGLEFAKRLVLSLTQYPTLTVPALGTGAGMRVDGTKAEGFLRSFVLDSYTQFNEGGLGIHILKNGYAQLVSIFTINCTIGLFAESGGQMSVNNSNCSFGLSGIVADGKSLTPVLTATLLNNILTEPQPDQLYIEKTDGTIQVPNSKFQNEGNQIGVDTKKLVTSPYNGMVFTVGNDPTLYAIRDQPKQLRTGADAPANQPTWYTNATGSRGRVFQLATTTFFFGPPTDSNGDPIIGLDGVNFVDGTSYQPGALLRFFLRSTITTSSHTMEYIGSGILLEQSVPGLGGRANTANEAVAIRGGGTYYTSTDQIGNFRVGGGFTIVQETGLIEGDTFKRAMLALMTPLILSLE